MPAPEYVASTGLAGLVLYFWRQDRRDRAEEKKAEAVRFEGVAKDFRTIVQDNTAAMTRLGDLIEPRRSTALGSRIIPRPPDERGNEN